MRLIPKDSKVLKKSKEREEDGWITLFEGRS